MFEMGGCLLLRLRFDLNNLRGQDWIVLENTDVIERWRCLGLKVKGTFPYVVNAQQKHNLELRSLFKRQGGKCS